MGGELLCIPQGPLFKTHLVFSGWRRCVYEGRKCLSPFIAGWDSRDFFLSFCFTLAPTPTPTHKQWAAPCCGQIGED